MPATNARRPPAPSCVRVPARDQGPPCPDCGGETFYDRDDAGEVLVCLDCVGFGDRTN